MKHSWTLLLNVQISNQHEYKVVPPITAWTMKTLKMQMVKVMSDRRREGERRRGDGLRDRATDGWIDGCHRILITFLNKAQVIK